MVLGGDYMAYQFNRDKYRKTFENMYGPGSYERGLNTARETGRQKAEVEYTRSAYQDALRQRQQKESKKTYDDALSYWSDPEKKAALRKDGAARAAEEIRNDPRAKEAIKSQGFTIESYIDAMYNAASDGKFRSEREYKNFAKELKPAPKPWEVQLKEAKKDSEPSLEKIKKKDKKPSFFDDIKAAGKFAKEFFNPFDDVNGKEAFENYTNRDQSEAFQEVARGANRTVDAASLGLMNNLDKRVNDREPYYNSQREIGEGGVTDIVTSGLGYLVPGVGAYKALDATKAGAALSRLGERGLRQRIGSEAAKGAITGGALAGAEVANREVLNPDDYSAGQNLAHLGIGIGAGAIADPALYGLGRLAQSGLSRFAKGDVPTYTGQPSQSTLDQLAPRSAPTGRADSSQLYDRLAGLGQPKGTMLPEDTASLSRLQELRRTDAYNQEFNQAVEQQYNYLKNSMGQGVDVGTTSNGMAGNSREVTGRYTVSNNPQWYRDFYAQNGRRPNEQELRTLAEQHVREGFTDQLGEIPSWQPKAVQEIDDEIANISGMLEADPSQAPALRPILEALEQDKAGLMSQYGNREPSLERLTALRNEPASTAISPRSTKLDDIVRESGYESITPENIAGAYNNKTWYHGTGTQGLTPNDLDPFVGNHEGLFGNGIYLTDEPKIAQSYAGSRSKKTGTPAVYEAGVKVDKVLDLEAPPTPEAVGAILNSMKNLDSFYQTETGTPQYFSRLMSEAAEQGRTTEDMIQLLRDEIKEFSNGAGISTSEFVEDFNALAINLKNAGFDGITHTGGARTGNDPHRVLILLDPNDAYSGTGRSGQVTRFDALQESAAAQEPSLERLTGLKKNRDYEPIEQQKLGGALTKLKPGELPRDPNPPAANIPNPKELVKKQISMEGAKEKKKWSFDKFYTAWVDDLRPLQKASNDLGGKDMPFDQNPYTQARLARGVAGKAETYLKGGVFDENGQKIGASLEEIVKPIESKFDDFLAYATSKRALDYDDKGLTAGIKPKDVEGVSDRQLAEATIRQLEAESPEFKATHQELVKYNNRLMDELVNAGVLDEATVLSLREENPNYIPMFRVQDPKVRGFEPLAPQKKLANIGDPIKKRTGSEREIINPMESIIKNTYLTLNMAERNRVGSSLLDLVEQAGENVWGRVAQSGKGLSMDDVSGALDEAGKQIVDGDAPALDKLFKGEGNKVYVYRDGQKVEMELQEDLYKAMLSLDTQKQNFFIRMLSVPTRMLRTGAVLSPDFGPVNIFRDQFSAYINSKYGFVPFVDMFSGLTNVLKKDDVYWQWKNSGGANSVLSSLDREYLQQDLRKMVKQSLSDNLKDKAKHPIRTILEPLRVASEITEEATRLGEFKKGLKKGATPKEAAYASRELIDFSRAGNLGRNYNQIVAFFNAAVQSIDKLGRTFKENPKQASINATLGITLPSIAAYYFNQDKEWYKEIPQRDRDLFWHFEVGDQIYKLPKPFEAGILFGTVPERTLDFLKENDPEAFEGLGKAVAEAFTPSWIPTAVLPWIEVYANKSFHFDSPIVPRREEGLLSEDQYGPYQSQLAKGVGDVTNQSPRKIEHVFKGYTGGLGKFFLLGTDAAAGMAGEKKPELPDRGLADTPILNRFVVKNLEGNNQSVNDFYKNLDKLKRENLSAKKNETASPSADAYKAFNQINGRISDLQAEKRQIIEAPGMSGEQKSELIKLIDQAITQLAKQGNAIR